MTVKTGTAKSFVIYPGINKLTLMFSHDGVLDTCQIDAWSDGSTLKCEGEDVEVGDLIEWLMEQSHSVTIVVLVTLNVDDKGVSTNTEFKVKV